LLPPFFFDRCQKAIIPLGFGPPRRYKELWAAERRYKEKSRIQAVVQN
jgi:hypothetical protein